MARRGHWRKEGGDTARASAHCGTGGDAGPRRATGMRGTVRAGARLLALVSPLVVCAPGCNALQLPRSFAPRSSLAFHPTLAHPRAVAHWQPALCSSAAGGDGVGSVGGGGGWGGRRHVGGGGQGDDAARPGRSRLVQSLLAVRAGDCWLSAQGASKRQPRRRATDALLCINVAVYILQLLTRDWLLNAGAKVNGMILSGQYYRLMTPIFLHGGLVHLLCNSLSLNAVGPIVEMLFGTERFVATYLLAGIGGNLASFRFGPSVAMSVGASGAIFGLVGALAVYLLRHRELYGERSERMLNAIMQTCLLNLLIGLIPGSRIDNWGHLGGAVSGAVIAYLTGPNLVRVGFQYADRPLVPVFH